MCSAPNLYLFLGIDDIVQLVVCLLTHQLTLRTHLTDRLILGADIGQHVAHLCGKATVPFQVSFVRVLELLLSELILDLAKIRLTDDDDEFSCVQHCRFCARAWCADCASSGPGIYACRQFAHR